MLHVQQALKNNAMPSSVKQQLEITKFVFTKATSAYNEKCLIPFI